MSQVPLAILGDTAVEFSLLLWLGGALLLAGIIVAIAGQRPKRSRRRRESSGDSTSEPDAEDPPLPDPDLG